MATKETVLAGVTRRTKALDSEVIPGGVRIQELGRAEWRESVEYAQAAEEGQVVIEPWHVAIFAYGVIDEGGNCIFTRDQVLHFPNREELWAEVGRIAGEILELSDQGPDALKKK